MTHKAQGAADIALDLLLKAKEARDSANDSESPEYFQTLLNIGSCQKDLGRLEEAQEHCTEALRGLEQKFGVGHLATANALNILGLVFKAKEEYDLAAKSIEK